MSNRKTVRLADICTPYGGIQTGPFGSQLHQEDYVTHGTPIITVEHLGDNRITRQNLPLVSDKDKNRLSKYVLEEGDIVFSRVGSVDRRSIVRKDEKGWLFSGRCLRVRLDKKLADPLFISFYFGMESFKEYIRSIAVGATMPSLNTNLLSNINVQIPTLAEQRATSRILGTLDDKIDLNRQMNETLEAMARAIFKDWFVDFGPVRAKAEGRPPYLAPDLWALFPDALDDDDKPVGWCISKLGDDFDLTMGQSPPGETYNEIGEGLPFFQGRTDFGFRYPSRRIYCSAPTRVAQKDDTLVSVRAPVGDLNLAWEKCCIGRGVAAVRHKSESRSFTYYSLGQIQRELQTYEHTGTVFGAINKSQFEALELISPSSIFVLSFEKKIAPLDERIRLNTAEIETLAQLRDLLLPRLMSGEIRLRDAEKMVEAVT